MQRLHGGNLLALAGLTCTLVFGAAGNAVAGKESLTVSAKPGAKVLYRLEQQNETNFAGMVFTENQSGDVEMEALENDADNNPRFAFTFANFEASVMQGGNLAERDPQLNGVVVQVTLSPRGEQIDLAPQSNLPQAQRDLVENIVDAFFAYLPENDVEPDDTWIEEKHEQSETEDGAPALEGEVEYTLEDFEEKDGHDCAKLFVRSEIKVNSQTPAGVFAGKAETEGEMFVALGGGHIVKSKLTTEITGNVGEQRVSRVQYLEVKMRQE